METVIEVDYSFIFFHLIVKMVKRSHRSTEFFFMFAAEKLIHFYVNVKTMDYIDPSSAIFYQLAKIITYIVL